MVEPLPPDQNSGPEHARDEEARILEIMNRTGAALASDAFFPFEDGPQAAGEAGVTAIIQPGGSKTRCGRQAKRCTMTS